MQLIPAIDLLKGDVVRLHRGEFSECTTYEMSAARLARTYAAAGAKWMHVVDLAASRDGDSANLDPLFRLLEDAPQQVQTGGGVRSGKDIEKRFSHGAARVVVGTLCVNETTRFIRWLDTYGADRLVAALDVHVDTDGIPWPRTHGWTEGSKRHLWDLLDELTTHKLQHLLCTDISKDGAMVGPNLALYRELLERYPTLEIQASGGVAGLRDLEQLKETGVAAAITGKALLEGCFTVQEALEVLA